MKTYTIDRSEHDAIDALVTVIATVDLPSAESGTIRPTQIRKLSAGWLGAEWVRAVADYQDGPSVGYASLTDLEVDHEITVDDSYGDFEAVQS